MHCSEMHVVDNFSVASLIVSFETLVTFFLIFAGKVKVKVFLYKPEVALGVPGG
jgi:hypothetical protein